MRSDPSIPAIADLTARFLSQQADARAHGIAEAPVHDVEAYEAAAFPLVEPRVAWDCALAALQMYDPAKTPARITPPGDWSSLTTSTESISAVALAAGNFPQMLRDLPAVLRSRRRSDLAPGAGTAPAGTASESWCEKALRQGNPANQVLALGMFRVLRQFDRADQAIQTLRGSLPGEWQDALANETAALAWHRGNSAEAVDLWARASATPAVLFNRGMSALFSDRPGDARTALTQAIGLLPDDSAWQHLAQMYLALCGI